VAVNPTGTRAYVTNFNSSTVSVIDTATNAVVATVPVGNQPVGVAVNFTGTRVYVVNQNSNNVSVIDTATNAVIGAAVPVGMAPFGVAIGRIVKGTSTTTVAAAPNPAKAGQSVTLTAHVTCTMGTPTGTVEFFDGTISLGTATLSGGNATLTVRNLAPGDHQITATYSGDAYCSGSTSPSITLTIKPRPRHRPRTENHTRNGSHTRHTSHTAVRVKVS
jgi:YVTN family beta-propeller protein